MIFLYARVIKLGGKNIFDIGTNYGVHSTKIAALLKEKHCPNKALDCSKYASLHCFEPDAFTLKEAKMNIHLNCLQDIVQLH